MSDWQPIETAPSGVEFLIFVPAFKGEDYEIEAFIEVCEKWGDGSIVGCRTHSEYLSATHWMPLPERPATKGGREQGSSSENTAQRQQPTEGGMSSAESSSSGGAVQRQGVKERAS